jgi:hypothetical protein
MTYNVDGQHANLLSAINIEDYNLSYVQGDDIKSFLSFDSLGKYIVMNNGISNGNLDGLDNMYLFDINKKQLYTISNENYFDYIRVWSNKSTYFAFAYKDGSKVKLYSLERKKLSEVSFDKGKIKNIAISDKGRILIQSEGIFIYDNKSNKIEKISDNGQILGLYNEEILIRKGESIYRGQPNNLEKINILDESFELIRHKCDNYIFSNQWDTIIYDAKNNETKKFHVNENSVIDYSSDFNKCLYRDASGISILDTYGNIDSLDLAIDDIMSIKWLDDDELGYIKHVGDSFKMSSFSVNRYNILTNTEKTIISLSNK